MGTASREQYDVVIIGSGPAGMGAAFELSERRPELRIIILDRLQYSSGGMRNDCKMNFTFPIGFPLDYWDRDQAGEYLEKVSEFLKPSILPKSRLAIYQQRAQRLDTELLEIEQTHLGTDGGLRLIKELQKELERRDVTLALKEEMLGLDGGSHVIETSKRELSYGQLLIAPGRQGFRFLQQTLDALGVSYIDNIVDIGIRIETRIEHYPIVTDYYDPKFHFPDKVRTFCTNSGNAHVVKELYHSSSGQPYHSVNGHAYSAGHGKENGLVNFAMLKTVGLTEPLASGQQFAENLGMQAMLMGGGKPLMQRVGDFRVGSRSKLETFNNDLYDFAPSLRDCCPGDISLAMPARVLRGIWKAMKRLDTIVPGILHPSTIMYYPEIKLYANKPAYLDGYFNVAEDVFLAGDGAGTSRGITAAWASGIRAAEGMIRKNR
ncbi:MAG: FAD-dependent oxidoreductase [Spirochaetia bacterium]|nr:FAD-dependent oxidoreductase [Spirochaetia bacterium]